MKRIYWDTAAGTPVAKRVLKAMMPYLTVNFGNPSSIHKEGVLANKAVEKARAKIARILFTHPDEIIFTGSGTESDNLAILGVAGLTTKKHIITTATEHKAVLSPCQQLQRRGFKVTYLTVDQAGQINLKELKDALTKDTFLVSVMMANNETGALQPIKQIAKIIRHFKKANNLHSTGGGASQPYFHTDACQAPRFLNLNVEKLGVDLMSFNGSKIYGPKGIGVLHLRRGVIMTPTIMGGGQERGLRSGTLNVSGIVGLAEALAICEKDREKESARLIKLRDKLIVELKKIADLTINGGEENRLPNNINFSVKNFEGEQLVIELDAKGFAVSSGSACSSHDPVNNNVRISFGRESSATEFRQFIKSLKDIIEKYRGLA